MIAPFADGRPCRSGDEEALPGLRVEPTLLIYYPLPMYFWFPKTDEGRRLAARAQQGMMEMIEDGTYDRIFFEYQREKIERLDLRHRRLFKLTNPFLGPETPLGDKRLWFDPLEGGDGGNDRDGVPARGKK